MRDCFGVEYSVRPMPGDGLCGYRSLSYALTGDQNRYEDIIEDLLKALFVNPQLFIHQTEFGSKNNNLSMYQRELRQAVANVDRQSVPVMFYMEDAHLVAFSYMFDVSVFVYKWEHGKWYVYGRDGCERYICLLHTGHHFDVLEGVSAGTRPPIPRQADKQGLDTWNVVQVNVDRYQFVQVHQRDGKEAEAEWPALQVAEVVGDGNGLSVSPVFMSSSPFHSFLYSDVVRNGTPVSSNNYVQGSVAKKVLCETEKAAAETVKCHQNPVVSTTGLSSFDCSACPRTFKSKRGLHIHFSKAHRRHGTAFDEASEGTQDAGDMESVASGRPDVSEVNECTNVAADGGKGKAKVTQVEVSNSAGTFTCTACSKTYSTKQSLRLHQFRKHEISCAADIKNLKPSTRSLSIDQRQHKVRCVGNVSKSETSACGNVIRYSCDVCDKFFSNEKSLRMHTVRSHKRNETQTVGVVGKKGNHCFPTATHLPTHVQEVHAVEVTGGESSVEKNKDQQVEQPSEKEKCNRCGQFFVNLSNHRKCSGKSSGCASILSSPRKGERHVVDSSSRSENITQEPQMDIVTRSQQRTHESGSGTTRKQLMCQKLKTELEKLKKTCASHNCADNSGPLLNKLTLYHDRLFSQADNILTEKLSREVLGVISDPSKVDDENRTFTWSKDDELRLNMLNQQAKNLQTPNKWTWAAKEGTDQYEYNHKRMQFLVEHELDTVVRHCEKCKSTGILVGLDQIDSEHCYDCIRDTREKAKTEKSEAWNAVRPATLDYHNLPQLYAGDKAVLALYHPVVTVRKNYMVSAKLRQESITLMNDASQTWTKVLPRTDLKDRFVVIERTSKDHSRKHIVANPERVNTWLQFLFQNHPEFMRMEKDGELKLSNDALEALKSQSELGEVVDDLEYEEESSDEETEESYLPNRAIVQPEMESGFSSSDIFTFDRYPYLYLKAKDFLKIRQGGKIEIIEDHQQRVPIYNASATAAFPYLYPHGEKSPLDFRDYKMSRYLMKKQTMFAYKLPDSRYKWEYAEDEIHMMYQYARLVERTINANTIWYLQQSPDVAHLPIDQVLEAFKKGFTSQDESLIDSKLPGLSSVMVQLPNSRERWFSERLGIEAVSRDCGDPNLFLTLNNSPRETYDTRLLLHKLEHGSSAEFDPQYFEHNTETHTNLMNKHAAQLSIYLYRKSKMFLKAFLCDICGIDEVEPNGDWTRRDRLSEGYYWTRVEFTSTRGVQHWHCIAKLPNVLDTGVIGRMIQNGRVVRQEVKCGNIKPGKEEEAWDMVEVGLLANRYATLFADSISTASFYTERMDVDSHDESKVIDVEKLRQQFWSNYVNKMNMNTHPIMRRFCDHDFCDANRYMEMAKVAAVSCIHDCIPTICGGNVKTGEGCRFDFPKKKLNHTVPGMMQVNSTQMEARMLLRRTCTRVPNLNEYFLLYWRGNHDMTVLIDAAHKMRYATKYAAKTGRYSELLNEIIEYLSQRSVSAMPPNMQTVLSQLLLADVSHRSFMTKQELAYHVMDLPAVRRTFSNVAVVGFYNRSHLNVSSSDNRTIVYSDRTDYSAYAERCRDSTVISSRKNARPENVLTKEHVAAMNFREFAETINHEWIIDRDVVPEEICTSTNRKFTSRDINSGHWLLKRRMKRRHIRMSTVLYTDAPCFYEPVERDDNTTQTSFFGLPMDKRKQLYRAYMELVCYVPWKDSPDESFLDAQQRTVLENAAQDAEKDHRYSLQRLEMFWQVYMSLWNRGEVAPSGSQWHRDNQYSYSMYLTTTHNVDMHMQRLENEGTLSARYEADDEVKDTGIDLHVNIHDEVDQYEYPSMLNFLPPDTFREVVDQKPPEMSEVVVGFPMQVNYQSMEELVKIDKSKLFLAEPPPCTVPYKSMTDVQKWAVDLGVDMKQQILYLCGKAGSGKTQVALKICELFSGHVQAAAVTGKAASLLGAPTVHGMFHWGMYDRSQPGDAAVMSSRKVTELQTFYEKTKVFVIDEVNAMSASLLAQLHETMTKVFNPKLKKKGGNELPFGGKKIVFLGDPVQLKPVMGEPIYGGGTAGYDKASRARGARGKRQALYHLTAKGQELYRKYLEPNCVMLCRGQRSHGLLQQICDRLRIGKETDQDRKILMLQRKNFPEFVADFTLHYENESCCMTNWRQLWSKCQSTDPPTRLYICRASYHMTGTNDQVVNGLAALPSPKFNFAGDVLCIAVGCDVRLIKNINVAAGLVNSATGTVVTVIYNNDDCSSLFEGKHPPPYCVIVNFPGFKGFMTKAGQRIFPFPNQPHWVPVYREKFTAARSDLPSWIVKKQEPKDCWREQFPLDLCRAMTCHRAQGQTLSNCCVCIDLGLDNPDCHLPCDIRSILYVALTRATHLKDLFVNYISPHAWEQIGNSEKMCDVEESLVEKAKEFASSKGMYEKVSAELDFEPDYGSCKAELKQLEERQLEPATRQAVGVVVADGDLLARTERGTFSMSARVVNKERYIGVDQGRRNFAIVVVDREIGQMPVVVAAGKYDLELGQKFLATDVLVKLRETTHLWSWMQQTDDRLLPEVDRVFVLIEQMSIKNRHWKQFGIDLGHQLQQSVVDCSQCIVRLSQPHLFRAGGVVDRLGEQIVQELNLVTITCGRKRARPSADSVQSTSADGCAATGTATKAKRSRVTFDDVEPSDVSSESDQDEVSGDSDYRQKKQMSGNIFRYFVQADNAKQEDMHVTVSPEVQQMWQKRITQDPKLKLDDLGDALLHALTAVLCNASQYRQLVPSSVSLHNNRTVAVAVTREYTYWAVIHCTWNTFELEDIGFEFTTLTSKYFNSQQTISDIKETLLHHLQTALTDPSGGGIYREVDVIQMVAKQLKSFQDFTRKQAGALTQSTMQALRKICDEAAGTNSQLCQQNNKTLGSAYIRTQLSTGHKFQVISSTGKLTNAMLCCLNWMHENAREFVDKRTAFMDEKTKLSFFLELQSLAESEDKRLEHILLSERAVKKLTSDEFYSMDSSIKCVLAYLILIGINKNEQRVKAIAANYRRPALKKKTRARTADAAAAESMHMDSQPTPST